MENYIANLTNDIKEANKKLVAENDTLREENIKLKEHIKVLEKNEYVEELEFNIKSLREALQNERDSQKILREDLESLSKRLDEFLALFANYISDEEADSFNLIGDKSLMFGVNIDSEFIKTSNLKALRNYLNILKCTTIQQFEINDFSTQKKSDIALIGEVFADFVRLANLTNDTNVYGLVEITMPDIINQNTIYLHFYGNKDISDEFAQFKQIYRSQLQARL